MRLQKRLHMARDGAAALTTSSLRAGLLLYRVFNSVRNMGYDLPRTTIFTTHILLTKCINGLRIIVRTLRLFILHSINLLVFVIETQCDLCEVISEFSRVN
jgi:hypothetical protein